MLLKTIATIATLTIALTATAAQAAFTPVPNEPPTGTGATGTRHTICTDIFCQANTIAFAQPDEVIIAIAAIAPDVATARCNAISRKVANSVPVVQINPPTGLQQCNLASKDGVNAVSISNAQWSSYGSYFVYGVW
jgi:hypothetical protein